jgi:dimethylargininase
MIALTHTPSPNMQECLRTYVAHAAIDPGRAARQHEAYCQLLRDCGVQVRTLDVIRHLPDCSFIEDTAVVLDEVAVLCSMGAASRRDEPAGIEPVLREYREVERIELPATIEGGDVLRVGRRLLVGLSQRTSTAGVTALADIVARYDYKVTAVPIRRCLHLKTACTALPDGRLLVNSRWLHAQALRGFELVHPPKDDPRGANVALLGNTVLLAARHAPTAELIRGLGFTVETIDISEFAKGEGGVTCLSLLFEP